MNISGPLLNHWESEISDLGLNDSNQDYLDITIHKYEKHPSIQMIKQNFRIPKTVSFQPVSKDEVKEIIKDLKNIKSVWPEIPTKILNECKFTFEILTQCISKSFASGEFPDCSKKANVSLIFKMTLKIRKTTDLLILILYFRQCMKNYFIIDCLIM